MKKKRQIPHTYVIVFFIILFAAALTWVIPGGEYQRETVDVDGTQRTVIVNDSFQYLESAPQTWQVFASLYNGFVGKADIIIFILLLGGAFWIVNSSKAIDMAIMSFLRFTKKLERYKPIKFLGVDNIVVTLIMLLFSIFGATFGMSEETIAFTIIFIPLAIKMGYDSITGVAMCFVGAGLGFAGALLNPFTIGIAQGLSDIKLFSGIEYRLFCWLVINFVGITYILFYVRKIRKDPRKSPVYHEDEYWRKKSEVNDGEVLTNETYISSWVSYIIVLAGLVVFSYFNMKTTMEIGDFSVSIPIVPILTGIFAVVGFFSTRHSARILVLNLLLFTILFLIVGVMGYGWFIMEIGSLFFAMGIFAGIAMNYSPNTITKEFLAGAKDILSAAMVVGLAGGILAILEDGMIIDTILYKMSLSMNGFGKVASVGMMYIFQTVINVVIPSGSAKAALTMPMMSQFSDLIGVSRQATVMAFQFGDGFTNMITPTSGVLIGVLEVAKIPYNKWLKWVIPFMIILIVLGFLLLLPTVLMDLKDF